MAYLFHNLGNSSDKSLRTVGLIDGTSARIVVIELVNGGGYSCDHHGCRPVAAMRRFNTRSNECSSRLPTLINGLSL